MFDAVPAEVQLVKGDDVFGEVVGDGRIDAEFPADGLFRRQKISHLYIDLLPSFFADKIHLQIAGLPDGDGVAPPQHLQTDNILQNQVDVPHIAAENRLPDAVVGDVVLLVGREDLLTL